MFSALSPVLCFTLTLSASELQIIAMLAETTPHFPSPALASAYRNQEVAWTQYAPIKDAS
jgi:hypothetical protein